MINAYQNKRLWKYILLVFAVVIASGSLLYTNYLVRNIAQSERTRAQLWALSMKQSIMTEDNDFLPYVLTVRDSSVVPAIVTDETGEITTTKGLDPNKTFIKLDDIEQTPGVQTPVYDPEYFHRELEIMKAQHEPIRITLPGIGNGENLIYYKDSVLLTRSKLFPYIQLSVIAVFLLGLNPANWLYHL